MPYVTTADGIRAYYDLAGSGPALVMVHGASQDSLSWQYVLDHFAPFYTVYALDLPGHGKSGMPVGMALFMSLAVYAGSAQLAVIPLMAVGRYGTADEIAGFVAYLVGPEAGYITGASLTIDGGFGA